jgi:tetratricopeptide (TPR) repeat protein
VSGASPDFGPRYATLRRVGDGATATAWHVRDSWCGVDVAVKVVHPALALHRRYRARFVREVSLSARLAHPCIVPVHDVGTLATGQPWVALGYARGGTLAGLHAHRPDAAVVLGVLDDVLAALAHLHAHGWLHQDVTPGNVLLHPGAGGTLRGWLGDLGVAEPIVALRRGEGARTGTPGWMAPERLADRRASFGPWTDLHAVGLLAREALGDAVSPALRAWVDRLAAPDIHDRFHRAADARRALAEVVRDAGMPPRQRPEADAADPGPWSTALVALRRPPIAGRAAELARMASLAHESIADGRARVVLCVGPRSAGRTRLVEQLARTLESDGWMDTAWVRYAASDGSEDGISGAVHALAGSEPAHAAADADAPPLAAFRAHVARRAARGGCCVVLEDAHRAHARGEGLAFAHTVLADGVPAGPVLVVCTLAEEGLTADESLRARVEALEALGAVRIPVAPLDRTTTRERLDTTVALRPSLADALVDLHAAEPGALDLRVRAWAAAGLLQPKAPGWFDLAPGVPVRGVPLDALARERLGSVLARAPDPAAAARAAALAALAGHDAPPSVLRALEESGTDALIAAGLLVERLHGMGFEHPSVDAAARHLAAARPDRAALHAELAAAWQAFGARRGVDADRAVGLHLLASGDANGALPYLVRTVRQLLARGRAADAVRIAARAVEAAEALPVRTGRDTDVAVMRAEARHLHAEALLEAGDVPRAAHLLDFVLRRGVEVPEVRARLRLLRARAARKLHDPAAALRHLDDAASIATGVDADAWVDGAAGPPGVDGRARLRAELCIERARVLRAAGRHGEAADAWHDARVAAGGAADLALRALPGLVEALVQVGRSESAGPHAAVLEALLDGAATHADGWGALALWHLAQRRVPEAVACGTRAAEAAVAVAADGLFVRVTGLLAEAHRRCGAYAAARLAARRSGRMARFRGDRHAEASALLQEARCAASAGDEAEARAAAAACCALDVTLTEPLARVARSWAAGGRVDAGDADIVFALV